MMKRAEVLCIEEVMSTTGWVSCIHQAPQSKLLIWLEWDPCYWSELNRCKVHCFERLVCSSWWENHFEYGPLIFAAIVRWMITRVCLHFKHPFLTLMLWIAGQGPCLTSSLFRKVSYYYHAITLDRWWYYLRHFMHFDICPYVQKSSGIIFINMCSKIVFYYVGTYFVRPAEHLIKWRFWVPSDFGVFSLNKVSYLL